MKRIGIITHYYNSINYGGNLQAYALVKAIDTYCDECEAEQICYKTSDIISIEKKNCNLKEIIRKINKRIISKFNYYIHKDIQEDLLVRQNAILSFNSEFIKHSTHIYNDDNLELANEVYDYFITGSDQVWNPKIFSKGYLLDFPKEDKIKFSYAASIAQNDISDKEIAFLKKNLETYDAISVREEYMVKLLQDRCLKQIKFVLDPTLLLSNEQWDDICSKRIISDNYLFCYFLGDDIEQRKLAYEYAKKNNLKVVTLPYLLGNYRKCDRSFGDYKLYNVSPKDFLSLVKYAECIFTDSFHACVFGGIYKKEYFVFNRSGAMTSNSRIYSLLNLYETQERFCDSKEKMHIEYISKCKKIDYGKKLNKLEKIKSDSIDYLQEQLGKGSYDE